MSKFFTNKGKRRGAAIVALALTATLSLGLFSACTEPKEEEKETPASKADTQLIKNGNFEFYSDNNQTDKKDKLNLINTPDSWSRSTGTDGNGNSAPSSDVTSGIINTAEWDYFSRTGRAFSSKEDALAHWEDENVTAYDRVKFYRDFDINSKDDFEYYDDYKYTVDYDDLKYFSGFETGEGDNKKTVAATPNPLTHDGSETDTSVLMIHNRRTTNSVSGTAQYYTSSTTVTLAAGTAAELSVWVKTQDLTYNFDEADATGINGAYIGVTHTVGGTTLDQMQIKNINTKNVTDNNGWKEYTVYVRASTFATSTFRIVLGLGFGSTTDMYETVNGFAFFDDLTCNIFDGADFEEKTKDLPAETVCSPKTLAKDKKFDVSNKYGDQTAFAIDLYSGFEPLDLGAGANVEADLTKEIYNGKTYTTADYPGVNLAKSGTSFYGYLPLNDMKAIPETTSPYLKKVFDNDFTDFPFGENDNVLMLLSDNGAPFTAKSGKFTLEAHKNRLISFFVKTNKMNGFTGAGATLVDGDSRTSISSVDTTTLAKVDIEGVKEDIYDGWAQCFFFVKNDTDEDKTFHLEFTYGPTSIVGTTKNDYIEGYAAFANFETYELSNAEMKYASTGDRAKSVTLTGAAESDRKFDDAIQNNPSSIETDIATPANYWGVNGGDKLVGGTGEDGFNNPAEGVYAGLVNASYKDAYSGKDWQNALVKAHGDTDDWWNDILGTDTKQPLVIVNEKEAAYGFIAESRPTVSSSSYQRISTRVKVSPNAIANIYLVDADDLNNTLVYELPEYTYWYDDEGNICTKDPASDDYNKKTDIAYYKQANGLYTKKDGDANTYYANLSAFEKDETTGNLLTASSSTAFYYNEADGKYYAYYDEDKNSYSTVVNDLEKTNLRYHHTEKPAAQITVDGSKTNGGWVTVSFYIHTGSNAKNYRLEVWSGSRDGATKNPADSYVFFDSNVSASSDSSSFNNLTSEAVKKLKDILPETSVDEDGKILDTNVAIYHTFTFFDSNTYLRYDETTDEDNAGNPWRSYKQSTKTEQLAYLYFEEQVTDNEYVYRKFIDFSATDVTVTPDATNDTEEPPVEDDAEEDSGLSGNVLLLIASGSMAFVLVLVIALVFIRRAMKKRAKDKYAKAVVKREKKEKAPKPAKEPKPVEPIDENDPYNK